MSYLAPIPEELQNVEVVKVYFHLQFRETFDLPVQALLQLRRELLVALKILEEWGRAEEGGELRALFEPQPSEDPQLRRAVQKPAPAFVLQPAMSSAGIYHSDQRLVLPALFIGKGIQAVNRFVELLELLGQQGVYKGTGNFSLEAVESEDASGQRSIQWSGGQAEPLVLPISNLTWLLERDLRDADRYVLDVVSPLRLLKKSRPLFKIDFADFFPFLLRRVNSMLASHAGVEAVNFPQEIIAMARKVETVANSMRWQDYRTLHGDGYSQELGGLLGRMEVAGEMLSSLAWVLQLGSYLNVGKGAAYGAGQYFLRTSC